MSYWTFSNVFEEGGVPSGIFNSTFGMFDQWGIARPSFHSFVFLHKLGEQLLQTDPGPILATRRADGSVAVLRLEPDPCERKRFCRQWKPDGRNRRGERSEGTDPAFPIEAHRHSGPWRTVSVSQVNGQIRHRDPEVDRDGEPEVPERRADCRVAQRRRVAQAGSPRTDAGISGGILDRTAARMDSHWLNSRASAATRGT